MVAELTPEVKELIVGAACQMTGFRRRQFQAQMALQYCDGKPRRAEATFGWGREAVQTGLGEFRTGIRCLDNFTARGRNRTEDNHPELVQHIRDLVDPQTQADRQLRTPLGYTRLTAAAVHQHLTTQAAGTDQHVPTIRTVSDLLNRLGYRLHRVRKTTPQKKYRKPTPSSSTCTPPMRPPGPTRTRYGSRSTPRRK